MEKTLKIIGVSLAIGAVALSHTAAVIVSVAFLLNAMLKGNEEEVE